MDEIQAIAMRLATSGSEESRRKVVDGLRDLSLAIESPHDTLQRIMFMVRLHTIV